MYNRIAQAQLPPNGNLHTHQNWNTENWKNVACLPWRNTAVLKTKGVLPSGSKVHKIKLPF